MNDSKVVDLDKRRKGRTINIGFVIVLFILLYISVYIYHYATKSHISIYQVQSVNLSKDNVVTGIALRDEHLVYTSDTGYINYFSESGDRVAKDELVYSIDENYSIYKDISDEDLLADLTDEQYDKLSDIIMKYRSSATSLPYSEEAAMFKNELQSVLSEIKLENRTAAVLGLASVPDTFTTVRTSESGIISYKSDSYCGLTIDALTAYHFNKDSCSYENLQSIDIIEAGTPVYRMISDDSWSIVIELTDEQYFDLKDSTSLSVIILKDNFELTLPAEFFKLQNSYYARLALDSYMNRYIDDRFLEIELKEKYTSGYKIPVTSVTYKDFYLIPEKFLSEGGDSEGPGVVIRTIDSATGEANFKFIACEIYHTANGYCYIDTSVVEPNTLIHCKETDESFKVNISDKLMGVYNVNKGYASFKRIEILEEGDAYYIISKDTSNGVALYDHIVLDASTATDSSIIY